MPVCLIHLIDMVPCIAAWTGMIPGQCMQAACTVHPIGHLKSAD